MSRPESPPTAPAPRAAQLAAWLVGNVLSAAHPRAAASLISRASDGLIERSQFMNISWFGRGLCSAHGTTDINLAKFYDVDGAAVTRSSRSEDHPLPLLPTGL